jgi:hypothetical protein
MEIRNGKGKFVRIMMSQSNVKRHAEVSQQSSYSFLLLFLRDMAAASLVCSHGQKQNYVCIAMLDRWCADTRRYKASAPFCGFTVHYLFFFFIATSAEKGIDVSDAVLSCLQ